MGSEQGNPARGKHPQGATGEPGVDQKSRRTATTSEPRLQHPCQPQENCSCLSSGSRIQKSLALADDLPRGPEKTSPRALQDTAPGEDTAAPESNKPQTRGFKPLNNTNCPFCVTWLLQAGKCSINTSRSNFTAWMETNWCVTLSAWEGATPGDGEQGWKLRTEEKGATRRICTLPSNKQ